MNIPKTKDTKHKFWIFLSNVIVIGDLIENHKSVANCVRCNHLCVVGSALVRVLFTLLPSS